MKSLRGVLVDRRKVDATIWVVVWLAVAFMLFCPGESWR